MTSEELAKMERQEAEGRKVEVLAEKMAGLVIEALAADPGGVTFDFIMRVWGAAREKLFHLPLKLITDAGCDEASPSSPS